MHFYCLLYSLYCLLFLACQAPRPQFEVRPVAIEAARQEKRRTAQERGESEAFVDGIFAICQASGPLVVGVVEENGLLLGRHQRRQLNSQKPERQSALIKHFPALAHGFFQFAFAIDRGAKSSAATIASHRRSER